jgi:hypothetical protein
MIEAGTEGTRGHGIEGTINRANDGARKAASSAAYWLLAIGYWLLATGHDSRSTTHGSPSFRFFSPEVPQSPVVPKPALSGVEGSPLFCFLFPLSPAGVPSDRSSSLRWLGPLFPVFTHPPCLLPHPSPSVTPPPTFPVLQSLSPVFPKSLLLPHPPIHSGPHPPCRFVKL